MLIKYQPKHPHLKCVPLIATKGTQSNFKITRKQVSLLPGTNEVTDEEWDIMKPHLSRELKNGEISVIEKTVPKSKKNPSGSAKNLKDMPGRDALVLIEECVNPDTLIKWHQEEIREEIRLVIVERMKELK